MRNRRPSPGHAEAVARRLALLEAELDATRRTGATNVGDRVAHEPTDPQGDPASDGSTLGADVEPLQAWASPGHGPLAAGAVEWVDLGAPELPGRASLPVPPGGHGGAAVEASGVPAAGISSTPEGTVQSQSPDPEGQAWRMPGRHAHRRRPARLLGAWPASVAGRLHFGPAHLTVVATIVVAALAITCWWLLAGRAEPVLTPVASPVRTLDPGAEATGPGSTRAPGTAASSGAPATPPRPAAAAAEAGGVVEIVVDVAGKVRRPGIVVLPAGSRVVDAIEAAGGARRGVDLSALNLARPLNDGEQILVGVGQPGPGAGPPPAGGGPVGAPGAGALVNINLAGLEELDTLPGVGPVTARAILDWRTRHGGFTAVDDLLEVDGIGDATLQKLAPLVTL